MDGKFEQKHRPPYHRDGRKLEIIDERQRKNALLAGKFERQRQENAWPRKITFQKLRKDGQSRH